MRSRASARISRTITSPASPAAVVGAKTLNEKARGLPFAGEVMRYVFTGTGMLTYAASLVCASVKVLAESATPDVQMPVCAGQLCAGADPPARRQARHDRRHVADAAVVARLCRSEIARPAQAAGDKPALLCR